MNKEEVMKLAREAGLVRTGDGWTEPHRWGMAEIERFAALVAAHKTEVAIAEAYRCGYEAGVVAERDSILKQIAVVHDALSLGAVSSTLKARGKE